MKINKSCCAAQIIDTKGLPQKQERNNMMSMLLKVSLVVFLGGCSLLPSKTVEKQGTDAQSQVAPQNPTNPDPTIAP